MVEALGTAHKSSLPFVQHHWTVLYLYNSEINFKTREDLRIGQINSLNFNWPFDTQLRRELPYYIFFEIPKIFSTSKICHKGELYYHLTDKRINVSKIKELEFTKFTSEKCHNFDEKNMFIYLIGYSINREKSVVYRLVWNNRQWASFIVVHKESL